MKNILIVGGAGYIGSHTVKHLMQQGYTCIVADNLVYGHRQAVQSPFFEFVDIQDAAAVQALFDRHTIDAVIHFAAYTYVGESVENPRKYYQNNLVGTLNLLDAMLDHDVKKIVFSSSCATYGNPHYTPLDEAHPQAPINPYGQGKFMVETVFADYARAYGLRYLALRYFNAAGCSHDGDLGESHEPETHLIPLVLKAIKGERECIKIFGTDYDTPDGTCQRDYIHVEDLALAHQLALEKLERFSGSINLGTGVKTSVKEIISAAEKVTGKPCPVQLAPRRAGDPAVLYAAQGKAQQLLGWQPRYTSIEEIIRTAWLWECHKKF